MKPVVTWIVVANTRVAKLLAHRGTGKGLIAVDQEPWTAPEAELPRDKAGVGHSIGGPAISAVGQTQPQDVIDMQFAKEVMDHISIAHLEKKFDRLILIAGPQMLGLLRANLNSELRSTLLGEIPKDLSSQGLSDVESHLSKLMAV